MVMSYSSLKEIIQQYVTLRNPNSKGWHPVLCKVCNDAGHKGYRAGFKFDGDIVGYNCFNCNATFVYNPSQDISLPQNVTDILDAFNIPSSEYKKVALRQLLQPHTPQTLQQNPVDIITELNIPPYWYKLENNPDDDWCQYSIEYLTSRGVDWTSQPFYCVDKQPKHPDNKYWYGRLIIPIYRQNKLVYYQGRDLTDLHGRKYLNSSSPRDNILYGFDSVEHTQSSEPIYIVEGWFDAYPIQGIAIFGNKLTSQQIILLNRIRRPKVVIPDRYGNGHVLANQAIQLGWKVGFLDVNDTSKDINESVCTHGLLYTLKTLISNTYAGDTAKIMVNLYCRKGEHK